jgi:hypothetical protein
MTVFPPIECPIRIGIRNMLLFEKFFQVGGQCRKIERRFVWRASMMALVDEINAYNHALQ